MAEQDLRDQVARILLPAAFERLDDGCADREDREEIAGALGTAGEVLSLISSTKEGWRDIDSAPEDGTRVLLADANGWVGEAWFCEDDKNWYEQNTQIGRAHV